MSNDSITGTSAGDYLSGFDGNDTLVGLGGDDTLDGGTGNDSMVGGAGDDIYYVDSSSDIVVETSTGGIDAVYSTAASYTIPTNVEYLFLSGTDNISATGNSSANTLVGNSGNNVLDGLAGNDTLIGGLGDDSYYVNTINDAILEYSGEGIDTIYSSVTWNVSAFPDLENITLTGTSNIHAVGNSGANTLIGNTGANDLTGGGGNDLLTGGSGNDRFLFGTGSGQDTITDFTGAGVSGGDVIRIATTVYANYAALSPNISFSGGDAIIDLGSGNSILVVGVTSFISSDFTFGS